MKQEVLIHLARHEKLRARSRPVAFRGKAPAGDTAGLPSRHARIKPKESLQSTLTEAEKRKE